MHLLVVATAERGLCGGFNSSIVRLAREHIDALHGAGKTVKILCVGKKGYDQLRRHIAKQIVELIDLRGVKQIGFDNADAIGRRSSTCSRPASSTSRRCSSRVQVGDRADADRAAAHPGADSGNEKRRRSKAAGVLRIRAGRGRNPRRPAAAQHFGADLPRAAGERRFRAGRAHERDGQRHAQRRRHDQQADDRLQPSRQAKITKELIEIISGAEAL